GALLSGVIDRNVAADADTPLGMQPGFALAFAAGVLEQEFLPGWIAKAKNHVRNELLKARVLLHLRTLAVTSVLGIEQALQVSLGIATEALEMADSVKNLGRNDEDVFRGNQRHEEILF